MFDIDKLNTWRILVIDDEPMNASLIKSIMAFYDVAVDIAFNGVEGLAKLDQDSFNIIMLDLSMPKMDGWEMLSRLRTDQTKAHIPVIAFTAHAMKGDQESVMKAGFDGYMPKPIRVATFLSELKGFLTNIADERINQL
ncbi:MAG: response regulator [Chloroflexi bacterium]|nr:response regulator [Chloroflexota bacterium]